MGSARFLSFDELEHRLHAPPCTGFAQVRRAVAVVDHDSHAGAAGAGQCPPRAAAERARLCWPRFFVLADTAADHAEAVFRDFAAARAAGFFSLAALRGMFLLPSGLPTLRDISLRFSATAFQSAR